MITDSLPIRQQVELKPFNSFAVSATAAWFAELTEARQLPPLLHFAATEQLPVLLLGGGSNLLLVNDFPGLVIHIRLTGVEFEEQGDLVRVGAGENWHQLVINCMNNGLHGIENLALIPGTVGAAPVQNIGAYGVELAQFLVSVEVYDSRQQRFYRLDRQACRFAYRDSIFKHQAGASLIITEVLLQLSRDWQPDTSYRTLRQALDSPEPAPLQLVDTVCRLRIGKLPDPATLGNAGSFFKNPLVSERKYRQLLEELPGLPRYPATTPGWFKIPAARLLESLGWKGRQDGEAAVHEHHALVLVNPGHATGRDIYRLAQKMQASVQARFGIALQPEVRIL